MNWRAAIAEVLDWARLALIQAHPSPAPQVTGLRLRALVAELATLTKPPAALAEALCELAAAQAAQLRLSLPPLADTGLPGPDALRLAAGLLIREQPALAAELWRGCRIPKGGWDLVLRHALAGPALATWDSALDAASHHAADDLRAASPLSAICDRPWPGGEDQCLVWIRECLLPAADGRRLLRHLLATPPHAGSSAVWRWRAHVLRRLQSSGSRGARLVLDVYEAGFVHHRAHLMAATTNAQAVLRGGPAAVKATKTDSAGSPVNEPDISDRAIERALAIAAWWQPLRQLRQSHPDMLAARTEMDIAMLLTGLRLCADARTTTTTDRGGPR